jgi:uncharacterized Zn finger protein
MEAAMPKGTRKKAVPAGKGTQPIAALRQALARGTKDQLIDVLLQLAEDDRTLLRRLSILFDVSGPANDLIAATRQAIADATAFDEREINYNFDYDFDAYEEVKRNLGRLIKQGQLRMAMELSLELMKQGSYQVEMSDEGLMSDDIEECLSVVLTAVKKSKLPAAEGAAWCAAMLAADSVACIAVQALQALQKYFQAKAAR